MTTAVKITRAWSAIAPKLVAFLATGLTSSGLIWALQLAGLTLSAELASTIVLGVSSVAAYIQRDGLLSLPAAQFSRKVIAFIVTSASAVTVVAAAGDLGLDLSGHVPLVTAVLAVATALVGYWTKDEFGAGVDR